jgi:hypothetical protein
MTVVRAVVQKWWFREEPAAYSVSANERALATFAKLDYRVQRASRIGQPYWVEVDAGFFGEHPAELTHETRYFEDAEAPPIPPDELEHLQAEEAAEREAQMAEREAIVERAQRGALNQPFLDLAIDDSGRGLTVTVRVAGAPNIVVRAEHATAVSVNGTQYRPLDPPYYATMTAEQSAATQAADRPAAEGYKPPRHLPHIQGP